MQLSRYPRVVLAGCLLLGVLVSGCGGSGKKRVRVTGRVTNAGNPIPVQPPVETLRVYFEPYREGAEAAAKVLDTPQAFVDQETGTFEATVPPGKYRICVVHNAGFDATGDIDKLGGKFARKRSPIIRDIAGGEEINIDISKPTG
jgi:hypothetical protein